MPYCKLSTAFLLSIFISLLANPTHLCSEPSPFEATKDLPIAFQGRFRSLDASARLWLYDFYHEESIKSQDLAAFKAHSRDALDLLWRTNFIGHTDLDEAPLFWIRLAALKSLLGMDPGRTRFSYLEISHAINQDGPANLRAMRPLLMYEFAKAYRSPANRARAEKIEMRNLVAGLWLAIRDKEFVVISSANTSSPWHFLKPGMHLAHLPSNFEMLEKQNKQIADDFLQLLRELQEYENLDGSEHTGEEEYFNSLKLLKEQGLPPGEISKRLEERFPLQVRLKKAGSTLKMLPSHHNEGEWLPLDAFNIAMYDPQSNSLASVKNFTAFTDSQFNSLRQSYTKLKSSALRYFGHHEDLQTSHQQLEESVRAFAGQMAGAYQQLANKTYQNASNKSLTYPSAMQLKAETVYYRLPLIGICLTGYAAALLFFFLAQSTGRKFANVTAWTLLTLAFTVHTAILALRCYILQRPPVSNMFETVIYVPWVAMAIGLCLQKFLKSRIPVIAACSASLALLILIKLSHADARMENVQAVLDSQYWLIVHVLMVVGSYGVFIISGLLGHYFLFNWAKNDRNQAALHSTARCILQTMYIGVALLIPGTILGGVWAAESWGRFWDWDPKESWAFISACVYLLIIHAYTFRNIHDVGLAVGSIAGLIAISFTWYGVNYILGTGLHSYGFGNGGEVYYYGYLAAELLFIGGAATLHAFKKSLIKK